MELFSCYDCAILIHLFIVEETSSKTDHDFVRDTSNTMSNGMNICREISNVDDTLLPNISSYNWEDGEVYFEVVVDDTGLASSSNEWAGKRLCKT